MAGETINIGAMAEELSDEIFSFFRWKNMGGTNLNFTCSSADSHFPAPKTDEGGEKSARSEKTHPVDAVFNYQDPYSGKQVYLHTDLKSYSKSSIKNTKIRVALKSLSSALSCAVSSPEWQERYCLVDGVRDIRGMLFVYNNDGEYDKNFLGCFQGRRSINTDSLGIPKNKKIHLVYPGLINYLVSIISDFHKLAFEDGLDRDGYYFYYPEQIRNRCRVARVNRPATIELLSGPFMIIEYDTARKDLSGGYIVYYNRAGSDYKEFVFLFDYLAKCQILDSNRKIRIRVACQEYNPDIHSQYERALNSYSSHWGLDSIREGQLRAIELNVIDTYVKVYKEAEIAGRHIK